MEHEAIFQEMVPSCFTSIYNNFWAIVKFPAQKLSTDPRTGIVRRHHLDPSPINKAIAKG